MLELMLVPQNHYRPLTGEYEHVVAPERAFNEETFTGLEPSMTIAALVARRLDATPTSRPIFMSYRTSLNPAITEGVMSLIEAASSADKRAKFLQVDPHIDSIVNEVADRFAELNAQKVKKLTRRV